MRDYNSIQFRSPKSKANSNYNTGSHSKNSSSSSNNSKMNGFGHSSTSNNGQNGYANIHDHEHDHEQHHKMLSEDDIEEEKKQEFPSPATPTTAGSLSTFASSAVEHHGPSHHPSIQSVPMANSTGTDTTAASTSPSTTVVDNTSPRKHRGSGIPPPQHHHHHPHDTLPDTSFDRSTANSASPAVALSAHDALALRRDGAEATLAGLRKALESSQQKNALAQAALAKSDAVILELRSSVRQLKRQLERHQSDQQKQSSDHEDKNFNNSNESTANVGELQVQLDRAHAQILTADMVRKELEDTLEAEQYTWELRVQDQERTIEQLQAECTTLANDLQQCRTDWKESEQALNQQIIDLQSQLEEAAQEVKHWKDVANSSDSRDNAEGKVTNHLQEKIRALEQERKELQSCLDEALKELEAVDAELQADNVTALKTENERLQRLLQEKSKTDISSKDQSFLVEPLHRLYRWILEQGGHAENSEKCQAVLRNRDPIQVISSIRSLLEEQEQRLSSRSTSNSTSGKKHWAETKQQVDELESQLSVYRGDLKAREESSAELRASLKEAVALLKPLQDAVQKGEKEKAALQQQIDQLKGKLEKTRTSSQQVTQTAQADIKKLKSELLAKEDEISRLQQNVEDLELKLSRAKIVAVSDLMSVHKKADDANNHSDLTSPRSLSSVREEIKAKRAAENTLKQMLRDAQSRFDSLHQQNKEVEEINNQLQGKLKEGEALVAGSPDSRPGSQTDATAKEMEKKIQELSDELAIVKGELAKKGVELRSVEKELREERAKESRMKSSDNTEAQLEIAQDRIAELRAKLASTGEELASKKQAEKALNRSLKEALGLLRPLQMHLEEAEQEKKEMALELRALRRRLPDDGSVRPSSAQRSASDGSAGINGKDVETVRELQDTIRQLERENSQLHDAIEDMSQSLNASHLSGMHSHGVSSNVSGTGSGVSQQRSEARLREELVELKSRNEVTQGRLEDAYVENHTLVEALKKREKEENDMIEELRVLRQRLRSTEAELEQAKYIATTALVRVDELTFDDEHQNRVTDRDSLFQKKADELEREMRQATWGNSNDISGTSSTWN